MTAKPRKRPRPPGRVLSTPSSTKEYTSLVENEDTLAERARIIQWLNARAVVVKAEFDSCQFYIAPPVHLLYAVTMLQKAADDIQFGKAP
jgi:hypothetical protein